VAEPRGVAAYELAEILQRRGSRCSTAQVHRYLRDFFRDGVVEVTSLGHYTLTPLGRDLARLARELPLAGSTGFDDREDDA
jgi:DNA-binding PadR family transcriptional regulator